MLFISILFVEHIPKEIKAFINHNHNNNNNNNNNNNKIMTNLFIIQTYNLIMTDIFVLVSLILCLQEKL